MVLEVASINIVAVQTGYNIYIHEPPVNTNIHVAILPLEDPLPPHNLYMVRLRS